MMSYVYKTLMYVHDMYNVIYSMCCVWNRHLVCFALSLFMHSMIDVHNLYNAQFSK